MNCCALLESRLLSTIETYRAHGHERIVIDAVHSDKGKSALRTFGIDRESLSELGLDKVAQDRVYKILYVYSDGFFSFIKDLNGETRKRLWFVFLRLTEANFNTICAVDSAMRLEFERTLRQLLTEHDQLLKESSVEFTKAQAVIQDQMMNESSRKHQAQQDRLLTQARTLQLEEYNAQIAEDLRKEREISSQLARELEVMKGSFQEKCERVEALESENEDLIKVKAELDSVTDAWRRVIAQKQVAEFEQSRLIGERNRMKKTLVDVLSKSDLMFEENEICKGKVATLTQNLSETTKALGALEQTHVMKLNRINQTEYNFKKILGLLISSDQNLCQMFNEGEDPLLEYQQKFQQYLLLQPNNAESDRTAISVAEELVSMAEGVNRAHLLKQASATVERLAATERQLRSSQVELSCMTTKLAAAGFIAQGVWGQMTEKLTLNLIQARQRADDDAMLKSSKTKEITSLEARLKTLEKVELDRDIAVKDLSATRKRELAMKNELESSVQALRRKSVDCDSLVVDLKSVRELVTKLEAQIGAQRVEVLSLKESEKRATSDSERKSSHLATLNLSMENLVQTFKALHARVSSLKDYLSTELSSIEQGSTNMKKEMVVKGEKIFVQLHKQINEDESLLPREKETIFGVISMVIDLEGVAQSLIIFARERNELLNAQRVKGAEVLKLERWARAERQRLHLEFERQLQQVQEKLAQKDLLVEQLQIVRKEQATTLDELRNQLYKSSIKFESFFSKARELNIPELECLLRADEAKVTYEETKPEAAEIITVDFGFDEDTVSSTRGSVIENLPSTYTSFDNFAYNRSAAPPTIGVKTGKSPLEQRLM